MPRGKKRKIDTVGPAPVKKARATKKRKVEVGTVPIVNEIAPSIGENAPNIRHIMLMERLNELKARKAEMEMNRMKLQDKYLTLQQKGGLISGSVGNVDSTASGLHPNDRTVEINGGTVLPSIDDVPYTAAFIEIPEVKVKIPMFDMSRITTETDGQRVAIFGMTGSGKSVLAVDIMRHNQHIPHWVVMSGSESRNSQYGRRMENDLTVFYRLDLDILRAIKDRQEEVAEKWAIKGSNKKSEKVEYQNNIAIGVILDDLSEEEESFNDPIFNYFHCVSRHDRVLFIELFQYYTMLKPKFRRQLSFVFVMRPTSIKDVKAMWSEFFGMYPFPVFQKIVNRCTENNGALVVDILSKSDQRVFFYKASFPIPEFKVGTKSSKAMMRHYYDPDWKNNTKTEKKAVESLVKQLSELEQELSSEEDRFKQQEKFVKELESKVAKAGKNNDVLVELEGISDVGKKSVL